MHTILQSILHPRRCTKSECENLTVCLAAGSVLAGMAVSYQCFMVPTILSGGAGSYHSSPTPKVDFDYAFDSIRSTV
jgi:hypothetical protein